MYQFMILTLYLAGQCINSYQLDSLGVEDEFECLDACKANETCSWFTHFEHQSLCLLFANCSSLDTSFCSDCVSGQKECDPPEPICWVTGKISIYLLK